MAMPKDPILLKDRVNSKERGDPMQYAHLGRSGVLVSRLCLGTMNFGWETNEAEAFQIMDAALDAGINFIDTANVYGFSDKMGEGLTEKIIGRWFSLGNRRDKIVLATKVFVAMGIGPNDGGLSAYHIRQSVEGSLKRLQTDHIDVLYMHHIDRGESLPSLVERFGHPKLDVFRPAHLKCNTRWEEIWQAMTLLVQQGKIIYVASSNFAGWNIAQACETADAQYNLTSRMPELEVIPVCREYELGLVPYSPLSNGVLAGGAQEARQGRRADMKAKAKTLADNLSLYFDFCKKIDAEPADVALAWLLHNPVVTAPIIGPRTLDQFFDSLHALDIELDKSTMAKLDGIWPGPGGEAPEAYAW
jgi:aryl-alcohol dehydrogenase-like predicted oxidoreductase